MGPTSQIRVGGEAYAISRDIVNLLPDLIKGASLNFAARGWPGDLFREAAVENGLTDRDLAAVIPRLAEFCRLATAPGMKEFGTLFEASGLQRTHPVVRLAAFCHLGSAMMHAYHVLARGANPIGHTPTQMDAAHDLADRAAFTLMSDLPHVQERRLAEAEAVARDDD